jgi:hypothetical protein
MNVLISNSLKIKMDDLVISYNIWLADKVVSLPFNPAGIVISIFPDS